MVKTCPHGLCNEKHSVNATFSECRTCGRTVCLGNGCVCSHTQARNPIRLGIGDSVTERRADGSYVRSYPYATAEAVAAGRVDEAHRGTPWLAPR